MDEVLTKVDKSVLSIPVSFDVVSEVGTGDDRFTKVKIWLMHTGENINKCDFDKSVIESALPTLGYIPIVGFIEEDKITKDKDFTNHRYILTKDENGIRRKYIGNGYGVVLSNADNNAHFEMRMCDDGIEREFLVVDGICWNMFEDSSNILKRDVVKSHSMELHEPSIKGFRDDNGIFHFTDFSFRAACILGSGVEPAMHNSTIEVIQFSVSDFMSAIQEELNDKYTAFAKMVDADNEGGNSAMANENSNIENTEGVQADFTMSVMQQFENISAIVRNHEVYQNRWGDDVCRYSLVDIQDNEVIVVDRKDNYNYFGFTFTVNGDAPEIDFSCGVRKKVAYVNYEDGVAVPECAFDFGAEIAEIDNKAFEKVETANQAVVDAEQAKTTAETNFATMESQYNQVKADYAAIKPKYDEYVKAEQERVDAAIEAEKTDCFARFEAYLGEEIDFIRLKDERANFSVSEIEEKCCVMYAKKDMATKDVAANFSSQTGAMTAGLMDEGNDENVGYVSSARYGNIHISR